MSELTKIMERARKNLVKTDQEVDAWENKINVIREECQKINQQMATRANETPEQLKFSFIPTQISRISPFFPMNRRDMKDREYQVLEWENSWGKMWIKGLKLSIGDESVLLAVLYLFSKSKSNTITTKRYELCKILELKPTKSSYQSIVDSLERLTGTVIKLDIKDEAILFNTMLSGGNVDKHTNEIVITVNEWFLYTYAKGFITGIDFNFRKSLKGDNSKSLYRFLTSQRENAYTCHLLTLAKAINMAPNLEQREVKKQIKRGLAELKKKGFLQRWLIKNNSDMVSIWKSKAKRIK